MYKGCTRVPALLEYTWLVWPSTRGVARSLQGSPRALALAERRRGQRSNLCGGAHWWDRYRVCGACDGAASPGHAKPPRWVGKRFRDRLETALKRKVELPAGLKMRPAWLRQDRLGANPVVCCGDAGCQALSKISSKIVLQNFVTLH